MVKAVPRDKASPLKRLLAKAVDGLVAWALAMVLPPLGVIAGLLYLALADGIQQGQSLGKMVFGLEVVCPEGGVCDLKASVFRNLPVAIAFLLAAMGVFGWVLLLIVGLPLFLVEAWLMVTDEHGQRLGDRVATTWGIEKII